MQVTFSKVINEFHQTFNLDKSEIEEVFYKPDTTDIMGGTYVSAKHVDGFSILITFEMSGNNVKIMNAYKIFPKMLEKNIFKMKAGEILFEFMNKYGTDVDIPNVGKHKIFFDHKKRLFFQGILDIDKYMKDMKS